MPPVTVKVFPGVSNILNMFYTFGDLRKSLIISSSKELNTQIQFLLLKTGQVDKLIEKPINLYFVQQRFKAKSIAR